MTVVKLKVGLIYYSVTSPIFKVKVLVKNTFKLWYFSVLLLDTLTGNKRKKHVYVIE